MPAQAAAVFQGVLLMPGNERADRYFSRLSGQRSEAHVLASAARAEMAAGTKVLKEAKGKVIQVDGNRKQRRAAAKMGKGA